MRKDLGVKPYSYAQPVFIIAAYDAKGNADAMNAAWCGIVDHNRIGMSLSASHKTVKNILETKALTISMATVAYEKECDYLGVISGNDVNNKLEHCHMTTTKAAHVNAPIINELPVTIECELVSYEDEYMIVEIKNVSVDESVLTEGKVDLSKVRPISFDPFTNTYVELTNIVGYAFKDGLSMK